MRLFIAVDLPETVKERLRMISCGLLPGARWVPKDQYHLTLRFIGEINGSALKDDIRDSLSETRYRSFFLQLEGIGFFPPRKKPHTLWVGVKHSDQLIPLRDRIEARLVADELQPEQRKFVPHVTLARLKNIPANRIGEFSKQHNLFSLPSFRVGTFRLYSSVPGTAGTKHYVEQEYPLDG